MRVFHTNICCQKWHCHPSAPHRRHSCFATFKTQFLRNDGAPLRLCERPLKQKKPPQIAKVPNIDSSGSYIFQSSTLPPSLMPATADTSGTATASSAISATSAELVIPPSSFSWSWLNASKSKSGIRSVFT